MDRTQRKRSMSRGRAARAVVRVACAALVAVALWPAPAPAGEADASPVPAARAPESAAPAAPDPEAGPGPDAGRPDVPGPDAGRPDVLGPGASDAVQEDAAQRSEADGPLVGAPAPQLDGPLGADPRANDDPLNFSWTFTDIDAATCKITGFSGSVQPTDTVHVPATSPAGKKVVEIARGSSIQNTYSNLKCNIDFSQATNLQTISTSAFQMQNEYEQRGPKGVIDLSKCTSLTTIGSNAFVSCGEITSLVLPPAFETVGSKAFYNCKKLAGELALPSSLKGVNESAFAGGTRDDVSLAPKLTSLLGLENTKLATVGVAAFKGNMIGGALTFPVTLDSVGASAFQNNLITKVSFLNTTVDKIVLGSSCFQNNKIKTNPLTQGVRFGMADYAFADNSLTGEFSFENENVPAPARGVISGNPGVTKVTISKFWGFIPGDAFKGLAGLKGVVIPANSKFTRVRAGAFQDCISLGGVDFGQAPLADGSASDPAIGENAFKGCTSLKSVMMGEGSYSGVPSATVTLGAGAFENCVALSIIKMPEAVSAGGVILNVKIGARAFKGTNLGALPDPQTGQPMGYLPLDKYRVQTIGASAFENANISDVRLPSTLRSVGEKAFAGNHIPYLELPNNAALDTGVGANVLADQTLPKGTAVYEGTSDTVGDVLLDVLESGYGIPVSHLISVALKLVDGSTEDPSNTDWQTSGRATFKDDSLRASGTRFSYGMNVYRQGSSTPVSAGSMILGKVEEGVPCEFLFYNDEGYSDRRDSHLQWVPSGSSPQEILHGAPNYGLDRPGYHTDPQAYDAARKSGWRKSSGDKAPVVPKDVVVNAGENPSYSNRWIANSYSVSFDDGWDAMVAKDGRLGMPDPADPDKIVRNTAYVSGTMDPVGSLSYGAPADLPGNAFTMGGYEFDGWTTSPDLAVDDRKQGSNYFAAGTPISTPDPAPADGGALTLFAQWKAVDYGADDPALLGFLSIPSSLSLEPYGDRVWSEPSDPAAPAGDHSVVVAAAPELPGATWPAGKTYRVSVTRPSAGAPLLSLSLPGGGEARGFEVLDASGAVYNPGDGSAPAPLMVIDPYDPIAGSGSFSLRSVDPVGSFLANARYSGTMEFRVDIVSATTREVAPGAPRAHAEGRSGTALVEYAPRSLAVPLSAAGPGRLELVDASGSVALSVRGGTVLAEAPEGGELSLRAVPDEGAYLASLRVGGRDASPAADGSLSLSAEEAAGGVEAAFAGGAPPAAGGPAAWVGGLTRTGDALPWAAPLALALATLSALAAVALARRANAPVPAAAGPSGPEAADGSGTPPLEGPPGRAEGAGPADDDGR